MKKLVASLASIAIAVSLTSITSCSSDANSDTSNSSQEQSSKQKSVKLTEGSEAPDFEFQTPEGDTASLSDYEGDVILLNFWATWCGYCIDEMPAMQEITENYPDVTVIAINRGDNSATAQEFSESSGYDFVWGLDENYEIERLYPSNGIPYSIIIDREGSIVTIYEGSASDMYSYFEAAVKAAGA